VVRPVRRAREALVLFAAAVCLAACKKKTEEQQPDAGAVVQAIEDPDLGFRVEVAPTWTLSAKPADAPAQGVQQLAEAKRSPLEGRTFLVSPRLVITAEPTRATDAESVIRATMNDLEKLDAARNVRINRTAMSTRMIDNVTVGDIEVAYEVKNQARDTPREVVHRSLVTLRSRKDGSGSVVTFTVTYMADDSEIVAAEVQNMIASLRFPSSEGTAKAVK
jgi:hypothetical protein